MTMLDRRARFYPAVSLLLAVGLAALAGPAGAQTAPPGELKYEQRRRINAHGDEYNSLALSADERYLFIGTESGDLIVWDAQARRVLRKLNQVKPVHHVAALADPRSVVAAGAEHAGAIRGGLVRKWNVETGAFTDLPGLGTNFAVTALAAERKAGLIAASSVDGRILLWEEATSKLIAAWEIKEVPLALAIVNRSVYVASVDRNALGEDRPPAKGSISELRILDRRPAAPQVFIRTQGRLWTTLTPSPDGRLIAAGYEAGGDARTALLDVAARSERASFDGGASAWIDRQNLLLFKWLDPSELIHIAEDGSARSARTFKRMGANMEGGRSFELSGQAASGDGSRAWSVYGKGAQFLEWDLKAEAVKPLINEPVGAYTLSVLRRDGDAGLALTGGADGYVRLWNLADLSLRREFRVAPRGSFVTNAGLLPDGRRAIVSTMPIKWRDEDVPAPTNIMLVDLETGEQKKILTVDQPLMKVSVIGPEDFLYSSANRLVLTSAVTGATLKEWVTDEPFLRYAVSANGRWVAVHDQSGTHYLFDLTGAGRVSSQKVQVGEYAPLAVTDDGHYVYALDQEGRLTKWDARAQEVKEIILQRVRDMHSRSDYITLAENDARLITTGNHGDIGIFDAASGEPLFYQRSSAAQVYIESAWLGGDRLIFTTDTGVMVEARLLN